MPNCIQYINKESGKTAILAEIDNEMRAHFEQPTDPDNWLWSWFDCVGLSQSMGHSYDKTREFYKDCPNILKVIDYLEERYEPSAWSER